MLDRGPGHSGRRRRCGRQSLAGATSDVAQRGLGLEIARSLAAANGGSIGITPRQGGGTVARLDVPAAPLPPERASMTLAPVILVVDDDPAIRESLARELRASGYTTVSASDGLEGVRAFETHAPDLVLTDLSMPRSDGFELISAIRATARTPIIVLSVRGNDADKIRALDLGADDFVTKPFSVAELLARVRAQLRRIAPDGDDAARSTS